MSRIDWIKKEKARLLFLVVLTSTLPLMVDWHNPAGIEPITAFGGIALMGWVGVVLNLLSPPEYRT